MYSPTSATVLRRTTGVRGRHTPVTHQQLGDGRQPRQWSSSPSEPPSPPIHLQWPAPTHQRPQASESRGHVPARACFIEEDPPPARTSPQRAPLPSPPATWTAPTPVKKIRKVEVVPPPTGVEVVRGYVRNTYTPDCCWKCGNTDHTKAHCTTRSILFCSGCGRVGVQSIHCCKPKGPSAQN